MFATVLISTSCCKEDDPFNEDPTSGELYPAYVGVWENDSTTVDGVRDYDVFQYGFIFEDVNASTVTNGVPRTYPSWSINGNTLKLSGSADYNDETFTITSPPSGNKMILGQSNRLYYLSK